MDYAYKGEWSDSLQNKLDVWVASQKEFLAEMEFELSLFKDFITVMVKDKQRTMGEIKLELQELLVEESNATEMAESLGRVLKSAENSSNPLLSRALQSARGSTTVKADDKVKKEPAEKSNVSRLLNSALQTSRANEPRVDNRRVDQRLGPNKRRDEEINDDAGSKKFRYNQQQGNSFPHKHQQQFTNAQQGPPNVELEPITMFEKMNEVAKNSGFKNAQEMFAAQKQVMEMMHGSGAMPPPVPFSNQMQPPQFYPNNNVDHAYMNAPMIPYGDPFRFDYFPQQHFGQYPGYEPYGYQPDARHQGQGRGYQGRGGRGSGRGSGRGHTWSKPQAEDKQQQNPNPEVSTGSKVLPAPSDAAAPVVSEQPINPDVRSHQSDVHGSVPSKVPPQSQGFNRGGTGGTFGAKFSGGRGGGFSGINSSNPFAVSSNAAPNHQPVVAANQNISAQPVQENAQSSSVGGNSVGSSFFGGGAGRGRGGPSAAAAGGQGNKVWVRKTES